MSGSGFIHCNVMAWITGLVGCNDARVAPVAAVGDYLLARAEHLLELVSKNLEIRPAATLKGTSVGDNLAGFDADTDLVAQPRPARLVCVPLGVERDWFQNGEVDTIDCREAALSSVPLKPVLPAYLCMKEE